MFHKAKLLQRLSWWMMICWVLCYNLSGARKLSLDEHFFRLAGSQDMTRQRELLNQGANIDWQSRDNYNDTALIRAVTYASVGVDENLGNKNAYQEVAFLLNHRANPNLRNCDGQTALTIASINKMWSVVRLLKEHGGTR